MTGFMGVIVVALLYWVLFISFYTIANLEEWCDADRHVIVAFRSLQLIVIVLAVLFLIRCLLEVQ